MTVTFWLLIAISTGGNNAGSTTTVGVFRTQENCEATRANMPTGPLKSFCVAAPGLVR